MIDEDGAPGIEIAKALERVANELKYLGNGNAASEMGAIEHLAVSIKEALAPQQHFADRFEEVKDALEGIATSIERGCERIGLALYCCAAALAKKDIDWDAAIETIQRDR